MQNRKFNAGNLKIAVLFTIAIHRRHLLLFPRFAERSDISLFPFAFCYIRQDANPRS